MYLLVVKRALDEALFKELQTLTASPIAYNHPHVTAIRGCAGDAQQAILFSDAAEGERLDMLLAGRGAFELPLKARARVLLEIVGAFAELHPLRIHGFPVPEMIRVREDQRWAIVGAGLHQLGAKNLAQVLNLESHPAPPEFRDAASLLPQTDVWFLGQLVDLTISGNCPIEEGGPDRHQLREAENVLGQLIDGCQCREPDDRFGDAADVLVGVRDWVRTLYPKPLRQSDVTPPPTPRFAAKPAVAPPPTPKTQYPKFVNLSTDERMVVEDDRPLWVYQVDGFDYGPFTGRRIYSAIRKEEIGSETVVRNVRSGVRKRLAEITEFKVFLEEYETDKAELDEDELYELRMGQRMPTWLKVRRKLPHLIVVALLGMALAVGGFFWLRPSPTRLGVEGMTRFSVSPSAPITLTETLVHPPPRMPDNEFEKQSLTSNKHRGKRPGSTSPTMQKKSNYYTDGEQIERVYNFDKQSSGRQLTPGDVSTVMGRVRPGIARCVESNFGGSGKVAVMFSIKTTGLLGALRIMGPGSGRLAPCIRVVLRRVRIKPFSGGAKQIGLVLTTRLK